MPSISFRCCQSPRCFKYIWNLLLNSMAFCNEPAKWQTTISIFLHMRCTIFRFCCSFRGFFLEVIKIGMSINILNNTGNQARFGQCMFSFLCFNFLHYSKNHWKWWESIELQGMPADYEWVRSFGLGICLVWEISAKLVVYIVCKQVCLWINFNIFKALCKLLGQSIHCESYDNSLDSLSAFIFLWPGAWAAVICIFFSLPIPRFALY